MNRANPLVDSAPTTWSTIKRLWATGKTLAHAEPSGTAVTQASLELSRRTFALLFAAMLLTYVAIASCSIHAPFFPLDDLQEFFLVRASGSWLSLLGTDLYHFFRPVKNLLFLGYDWLYLHGGMEAARALAVVIGLASACAVFKLCCRLLADRGWALVATAIWLLSPTLVSCTAWLSASNIMLMTGLAAVALTCHDLACESKPLRTWSPEISSRIWDGLALLCFCLALAAYEGGVGALALFPAMDWYLYPARLRRFATWRRYFLYGLVLAIYLIVRHQAGGTQNVMGGFSGVSRVQAAISSGYLTTLHTGAWVWPFNRMAVIGGYYWGQVSIPGLALCALLVLAAIALSIVWRRRYPHATLGILWFLLAFAPMSNVLGFRNGPYCDSYLALASVGAAIALAAVIRASWPLRTAGPGRAIPVAVVTMVIASRVAAAFEAASWSYAWNDPAVAYQRTLRTFPRAFDAITELAKICEGRGEHRKADELAAKAISMAPDRSGPYAIRAVVAEQEGRFADALKWLVLYRTLAPSTSWGSRFQAEIYEHLGRAAEAEALYRQAISQRPWSQDSLRGAYELAYLLAGQGRQAEAISVWEECLTYHPDSTVLHWNLSIAYAEQGDQARASSHLRQAQPAQQASVQTVNARTLH